MILFLLACSTGDVALDDTGPAPTDDTGETDPDAVTLDGMCEDDVHRGQFTVESNEDYAYVTGAVSDGVVPVSILTPMLVSGECTIWRRENPYCDPGCDPGYTCDFDGTCVAYPVAQDVGTVTVDGLASAVSMSPVTPGYSYFDTSLDNPPWEPGSLITLKSSGGTYAPFTLYGVAPDALEPTSLEWEIPSGQPFAVGWDAPAGPVRTEVTLTLRIDQHGLTPARIECVFVDDGAGEVPADVLDSLLAMGISGFPEGDIARRSSDNTTLEGGGCVDLDARVSRLPSVSVAGYTPCTRDEDCPVDLTCNEAMERCE